MFIIVTIIVTVINQNALNLCAVKMELLLPSVVKMFRKFFLGF